jgi:hypothetical protein
MPIVIASGIAVPSVERYHGKTMPMTRPPHAAAWLEQWRAAGPALAAERRRELQALTPARALAAAEALLSLAGPVERDHPRWHTTGLVEFQRLMQLAR